MKYEEWIKYEESRKRAVAQRIWISIPAAPNPRLSRQTPPLLKRSWTLIMHLFNSLLP